ncbi:methylmalonyl Co-A mutase-associated GTPase MeaB [Flavobacteriaceae bacterium]|jgi:LAO/AO transport system kinase|nr:methylmalonyl Co-A mutase-associated GTPase MeaB [Flavobacteriaceae bacterium]MDC3195001.1 methylmalonyl Co-A mutase-associated GTPase MeaB [Flavobacteriaceae bacterium]|tara:strand:+ start:214 stop:1293 length:1080 start_codon:yes stop_codon:yes gene_type:complete
MAKRKISTLFKIEGVSKQETTSKIAAKKIKLNRNKIPSTKKFISEILAGNISFLSRAITLIESSNKKHQEKANIILNECLPHANKSIRIGITGVPGVGKSTFIEALGMQLTEKNKKVAVLAIDPSSSINKGSILGDKTRMEELVNNKHAFIRPSPAGSSLGGVAQKTRETIILCEAAGFDTIIIETVGVGQSETMVHSMVDFFLLLKIAGAGDELQGIKRGIIEMADAIIINKADGENIRNASIAKVDFTRALHLYPQKNSGWKPKVLTASALEGTGVNEVMEMIESYISLVKKNNFFVSNRNHQNISWLKAIIEKNLYDSFYKNNKNLIALKKEIELLENNETTPFSSAKKLLKNYNG